VTSRQRTWVIGAGGLLGQHVQAAAAESFVGPVIPWSDPQAAKTILRQGIRDFLYDGDGTGDWSIAWCAGAGVVATSAAELEAEQSVFRAFLDELGERAGSAPRGAVFFASSAGAVFAGSSGPPFTESSPPVPRTPYGAAKLEMEADLRRFSAASCTPVLIGRIANLYGPGQNLAKAQGLVSHICRSHLTGQPLFLYVPLDTMRDYVYVQDCAAAIVAGLAGIRQRVAAPERAEGAEPAQGDERDRGEGLVVTKILASGLSTTVAGLLGESARLFRRRPRVVLGSSPAASGQVRDLRLRSTTWTELDRLTRTPLPVGLAVTARDVGRRLREAAVPLARGHQH
jgi:UDP-glucose 4-epimerase